MWNISRCSNGMVNEKIVMGAGAPLRHGVIGFVYFKPRSSVFCYPKTVMISQLSSLVLITKEDLNDPPL
jgi:hypothetical protein